MRNLKVLKHDDGSIEIVSLRSGPYSDSSELSDSVVTFSADEVAQLERQALPVDAADQVQAPVPVPMVHPVPDDPITSGE